MSIKMMMMITMTGVGSSNRTACTGWSRQLSTQPEGCKLSKDARHNPSVKPASERRPISHFLGGPSTGPPSVDGGSDSQSGGRRTQPWPYDHPITSQPFGRPRPRCRSCLMPGLPWFGLFQDRKRWWSDLLLTAPGQKTTTTTMYKIF